MHSRLQLMRHPVRFGVAVALLVLFSCELTLPVAISAVNVAGTWDMEVNSQEGIAHPSITLKQEGDRISGTYSGKIGSSSLEGTLSGSEIRFTVTLKFQEVSYSVTYSGTVTDDTMKGTARFSNSGTGTWTAKRKKT
jgi:hypothetical protein